MTGLWTAAAATAATGGRSTGDWVASGVSIDTRTLQKGDLFVALKDLRDGHDFVAQALQQGAAAALVSHVPVGCSDTDPLLIVDDVLAALTGLATAARARTKARVIAITGSVGKTSSKEMLRSALQAQGRVHAAEMSFNNHWGVPLTLARMPQRTDFAIIEIGMNQVGEIAPLSRLARPHVAVITTVAAAHMAAFRDVADIASAKAEIFAGLQEGGTAILNRDIDSFAQLQTAARRCGANVVGFGTHKDAKFRLINVHKIAVGSAISTEIDGVSGLFKLAAPGRHLAMNAMAVLAAVAAVGADTTVAALDLNQWQPPAGRGRHHWITLDPPKAEQRLQLIDDAYNANPASMAAAFAVLANSGPVNGLGRIHTGRRIAILTDMLELGRNEVTDHRDLAKLPALAFVDTCHCAGPLMSEFYRQLPVEKQGEWHESAENLAARVYALLDAGDVVMVKGSKGSKASLVVDAIMKLGHAAQSRIRGDR